MTRARPQAALTILIALLAVAACSTKVRDVEAAPDFDAQLAATPVVGIGDVTVAVTMDAVLAPPDSLDAVEVLYRSFLTSPGRLDIWHPTTISDLAGAESLHTLALEYARYGRLRPDQVQPLAAPLSGCRFLAFGRLTDDQIESNTQHSDALNPQDRVEGTPERYSSWAAVVSVERKITVTLEIFDLTSGESVWRGEAEAKDRQLYEYEDTSVRTSNEYLQERLATDDAPAYLSRGGDALKAPDLIDLMQTAFTKLVGRLPAAES